MDAEKMCSRMYHIRQRLQNRQFTRDEPLHAATLDLERKVLENEERALSGEPRQYAPLYY